MDLHQDFKDLLAVFDEAEVQYLVVGGYAVSFHSRPRFTKDIDLWIAGDETNIARACDALTSFGAPTHVVELLRTSAPSDIVWMGAPPTRVDILRSIPGLEFEGAWERRVDVDWAGVHVAVVGLDDLIAAKKSSGRPQDRIDLRALTRARERRGSGSEP